MPVIVNTHKYKTKHVEETGGGFSLFCQYLVYSVRGRNCRCQKSLWFQKCVSNGKAQ